MQIKYHTETKNQEDNPFAKMDATSKSRLQIAAKKRLYWLAQLGSSMTADDQNFYDALVNHPYAKLFGKAPHYANRANTGIAVLAGAIEKLERGDLSMKQIKRLQVIFQLMHECYPDLWDEIEFIEERQPNTKKLFEF